jgi:hypothetical protein
LLVSLTGKSYIELQNFIAFEEGFERLQGLIAEETAGAPPSMLALDCLQVMKNTVKVRKRDPRDCLQVMKNTVKVRTRDPLDCLQVMKNTVKVRKRDPLDCLQVMKNTVKVRERGQGGYPEVRG